MSSDELRGNCLTPLKKLKLEVRDEDEEFKNNVRKVINDVERRRKQQQSRLERNITNINSLIERQRNSISNDINEFFSEKKEYLTKLLQSYENIQQTKRESKNIYAMESIDESKKSLMVSMTNLMKQTGVFNQSPFCIDPSIGKFTINNPNQINGRPVKEKININNFICALKRVIGIKNVFLGLVMESEVWDLGNEIRILKSNQPMFDICEVLPDKFGLLTKTGVGIHFNEYDINGTILFSTSINSYRDMRENSFAVNNFNLYSAYYGEKTLDEWERTGILSIRKTIEHGYKIQKISPISTNEILIISKYETSNENCLSIYNSGKFLKSADQIENEIKNCEKPLQSISCLLKDGYKIFPVEDKLFFFHRKNNKFFVILQTALFKYSTLEAYLEMEDEYSFCFRQNMQLNTLTISNIKK